MRRLLPLLLLSLAALPALGAFELTLRVDSRPYKGRSLGFQRIPGVTEEPAEEPAEQSTARVTLGDSFLRHERDAEVTVYDFARRRVFVTAANKPPVERSLFGDVGGRDREMTNRVYLQEMMRGQGPIPIVVSEHELSMRASKMQGKVDRSEKKGKVHFRGNRLDLAEYALDFVDATNEERAAFARFIRLAFNAHPVILEDLQRARGIPRTLRLVHHTSSREFLIAVTGAAPSDRAHTVPEKARLEIESDANLGPLVAAARGFTLMSPEGFEQKLLAEAAAFAAAGARLDAFLAWMEYGMATDRKLPAEVLTQLTAMAEDPQIRAVTASLSPRSAEEARKALTTLESVRAAAPARGYVLSIFQGDFHSNLGESGPAEKKFMEALAKQPRNAGVWKDLGQAYYNAYHPIRAWDCWTVARGLVPDHALLADVKELEARLLAEYPGFF